MEAFEKLEIWKRSTKLSSEIYRATQSCTDWGFRDQITRSALSVPCNIAEGYERNSEREFCRFLRIAKGSCGELRTQLYIAIDVGLMGEQTASKHLQEAVELSRMIQGMIKRVESQLAT